MLYGGLFVILILSIVFLALTQVYNDTCMIADDPVATLEYAQKQKGVLTQLLKNLPEGNFTDFDVPQIMGVAEQCFAGSAYSGTTTLAARMGLNSLLNANLAVATDALASGQTVDLSSFVDTAFDQAKTEINSFTSTAGDKKMPESLIADAGTSCTQCKDFKTTLVNFQQKYGGNGMESLGDACDEACSTSQPASCPDYVATSTASPVSLKLEVVTSNGQRKLKFPNGDEIAAPAEILDRVEAGEDDLSDPCKMCQEKLCSLSSVGPTINTQIDHISGNLTSLLGVIDDTAQKVKDTQDTMLQPIKDIVDKAAQAFGTTLDTVNCSLVGDVFHTVYSSVCDEGLGGFRDYSWFFVWCGFFGLVVIVATIVLNLCVGLRPLEAKALGKERDLPAFSAVEMGQRAPVNAYLPSPTPDRIPNPAAVAYAQHVPQAVPAMATPVPITGSSKGQYV